MYINKLSEERKRRRDRKLSLPSSEVRRLPEIAESIIWPAEICMPSLGLFESSWDETIVWPAKASSPARSPNRS